jgi:tetratricopeptide (TPR) repeat protein
MPSDSAHESREALSKYDPVTEVCVCGEVPAGIADEVFTVVACMPVQLMVEKQHEQQKKWHSIREQVLSLKSLGNAEMHDREIGSELAAKSYQEGLRILLQTTMEDHDLEMTLRLNLAEALARCSRWEDSAAECKAALLLEPSNIKALYRHGRALLRMNRPDEARVELFKAARAAPSDRLVREELEAARNWVPQSALSETKPPARFASTWRLGALHFWRHFYCSKLKLMSACRVQVITFLVLAALAAIRLRRRGRR